MLNKWQELSAKDQRLVLIMVISVSLFVAYRFMWQPLTENITKQENKIARQQELLTWIQDNTALYIQKNKNGDAQQQNSGSLSGLISRSASRKQIAIARIQPQGDDIQVTIDSIEFNQLLTWLQSLAATDGIMVKALDLSKEEQSGVVRVRRLSLGRG